MKEEKSLANFFIAFMKKKKSLANFVIANVYAYADLFCIVKVCLDSLACPYRCSPSSRRNSSVLLVPTSKHAARYVALVSCRCSSVGQLYICDYA